MGFSPECGTAQLSLALFVSSSWSTIMTSIIFLFELGHLNDHNGDIKGVLNSLIFVVEKATTPKNGVEFCH